MSLLLDNLSKMLQPYLCTHTCILSEINLQKFNKVACFKYNFETSYYFGAENKRALLDKPVTSLVSILYCTAAGETHQHDRKVIVVLSVAFKGYYLCKQLSRLVVTDSSILHEFVSF